MPKIISVQSDKSDSTPATCQVEAVLSIDNRGQIVIPKEVRRRANIRDGDKLALVSWMNRDKVCCLALIPYRKPVFRSIQSDAYPPGG